MTFDSVPSFSEWAAISVGFDSGAGVIITPGALDAQVQQLSVDSITNVIPSSSVFSQANYARWNSQHRLIQSRPGNNWCAAFVGKFHNATPLLVQRFELAYDLNSGALTSETVPGFRVYYSLTGDFNSWQLVESLSTDQTGKVTAAISLFPATWNPGTPLYVLWADDNGPSSPDGYYTVDNVALTLQPTLHARRTGPTEIELSWSQAWADCTIESSTNVVDGPWGNVTGTLDCTNGVCRQRVVGSGQRFYRLTCAEPLR